MPLFSPQLMKRQKNKNELFNYFRRMLLKFDKKKLEIHKHGWLSIIWIFKKLNSLQTLAKDILEIRLSHKLPSKEIYLLNKTYKKLHSITWTLVAWNKSVFHPNNCLVPLWILSYRESTVAAPISSLPRYIHSFIFFFLACNTDSILKPTHCADYQDYEHKPTREICVQFSKKLPYFFPLEEIFK